MSSIIIKSLLLPENQQTNRVALKPLHLQTGTTESKENTGFSRLDSLKLSNTQGAKGLVPVNLLNPPENQSKAPAKPLFNKYIEDYTNRGTLNSNQVSDNKPQNNIKLKSLSELRTTTSVTGTSTYNATYTHSSEGKQVVGKVSTVANFSFIETNDITDVKLNNAIDKIKVWGMKVGNLKSLMDDTKSNSVGVAAGNIIIATSTQVAKARTEAETSRKEALDAYNDAVLALKNDLINTGVNRNSDSFTRYDSSYNQMEKLYEETKQKHESTWSSAKSWMWTNLQVAIDSYLN